MKLYTSLVYNINLSVQCPVYIYQTLIGGVQSRWDFLHFCFKFKKKEGGNGIAEVGYHHGFQ
jgi:hypothetical protein